VRPDFWHHRWRSGQTGFHQASVDADLIAHWGALSLREGDRVMVPLCGKSIDLLWLRERGHAVVGIELSDIALQAFCAENGIPARRQVGAMLNRYEAFKLELFQSDFLTLSPAQLGEVQAVYDRASLISWAPDLRKAYVDHLTSVTSTGTQTLLVTLEYEQSEFAGPPFSVDATEVQRLYAESHAIQEIARRSILSDEPRMRARGVSSLTDVCYKIVRL
jgi:thiopurine S-methyltransferase